MCYGLTVYNATSQTGIMTDIIPNEGVYDMSLWTVKLLLVSCNEAVAVFAILSGIVKVLGLDGRKEVAVELEKDAGRMA